MLALSRRAIVVVAAALAVGCVTSRYSAATVVLRVANGAIWIRSDEIGRFACEDGVLVCDDGGGRLTRRRCRCVP